MSTREILKPPFSPQNARFCTSGKVLEYYGRRAEFHLQLFNSPISGQGLKVAFGKISKGWPVIRYVGPILTQAQVKVYWERMLQLSDNPRVELFTLDAERSINGARALAAYVNHSCAPNCRIYTDPKRDLVAFYASREIFPDEELTIDYGLYQEPPHSLHPCACGASECRGYMDSAEMIRKVKALEARQNNV